MKDKSSIWGSCQDNTTRWGQFVTVDHIVSISDAVTGVDGNNDVMVLKDFVLWHEVRIPCLERVPNRPNMIFSMIEGIVRLSVSTRTDPENSNEHSKTCI